MIDDISYRTERLPILESLSQDDSDLDARIYAHQCRVQRELARLEAAACHEQYGPARNYVRACKREARQWMEGGAMSDYAAFLERKSQCGAMAGGRA